MSSTDRRIFFGKISGSGAAAEAIAFLATLIAAQTAFAQTETILVNLQNDAVGYSASEGVAFDSSGNLYGVTGYGGATVRERFSRCRRREAAPGRRQRFCWT